MCCGEKISIDVKVNHFIVWCRDLINYYIECFELNIYSIPNFSENATVSFAGTSVWYFMFAIFNPRASVFYHLQ